MAHFTTLWKSWSIGTPSGRLAWEAAEYIYCARTESVKTRSKKYNTNKRKQTSRTTLLISNLIHEDIPSHDFVFLFSIYSNLISTTSCCYLCRWYAYTQQFQNYNNKRTPLQFIAVKTIQAQVALLPRIWTHSDLHSSFASHLKLMFSILKCFQNTKDKMWQSNTTKWYTIYSRM
jgi:hypothetical protein